MIYLLLLPLFGNAARPAVGAIRWDAWNQISGGSGSYYDTVSWYTRQTLAAPEWNYRLPFYASVKEGNVSYNADNQTIMDLEIAYAKHAGIDYFAFDSYCSFERDCVTDEHLCVHYIAHTSPAYCPQKPAYGLQLYLNSSARHLVNFTLILLGAPVCIPGATVGYVNLMLEKGFQTTSDGRPVLYLFQFSDSEAAACGGWSQAAQVFSGLRISAKAKGLLNPYLVLMDFDPNTAFQHSQLLGFDAISTYALTGGTVDGLPFASLAQQTTKWWADAASVSKNQVVPIVPMGWDPRPRAAWPNPFVDEGPEHFLQCSAKELTDIVSQAVDFTCKLQDGPGLIIMYAWNENNENGAVLVPTLGNGTLYVDALSQVLPRSC